MLSIDINSEFRRQIKEYALFILEDQDYGLEPITYVKVAFWIKTDTEFLPCVQVENGFIEADLAEYYGTFQRIVSEEEVNKSRKYSNTTVYD